MTDEAKGNDTPAAAEIPAAAAEAPATEAVRVDDPMAKAKANGYVEPPAPNFRDRVTALIADVEHAMANNAPMTSAMLAEMKALLTGE